jgi:hypothetical protein
VRRPKHGQYWGGSSRPKPVVRLQPSDDGLGIHTWPDDLEGDAASHGAQLVGDEDDSHAPLSDLLEELVRSDDRPGPFADATVIYRDVVNGLEPVRI